ncbi:MAG: HNH endonuclease [Candidatus Micrarchaeota archaeon]
MDGLRAYVLERDHYKCTYCDFHAEKWQTIWFLDGDSSNNKKTNLTTVCPMCNLILNTRVGCQIEGIVELYEASDYDQNRIVQMTRKMRAGGKTDNEIIRRLGLKVKVPFKPNKKYLSVLFAFVTSWKGSYGEVEEALQYGYSHGL